jgi:arylsulfatase A-like enzyme
MLSGPSGLGVDDLYAPELSTLVGKVYKSGDIKGLNDYDDLKVEAVLNEIAGKDHTGKNSVGVPSLFGMGFQVVRIAQVMSNGGYTDASGTMSAPLLEATEHIDQSIGKMVSALKARGLYESTLIIVTGKHGNAPMDTSKHRLVEDTVIPKMVNQLQNGLVALSYADGDIISIWLTDQSQTAKVAAMLNQPANQSAADIQKVYWGESLKVITNDPLQDDRMPDLVVIPNFGTRYFPAGDDKVAAHGGFSDEDTLVALFVSNPGLKPRVVKTPVRTAQVAPTILQALGLAPESLQAVVQERTPVLPYLFLDRQDLLRVLSAE